SKGPAKSCVVDRITAFASELHDLPPGAPERAIAFKFVLHLVGDVHQPLHAADHNDAGGNGVLVLSGRQAVGRPLNAYWDTVVVKRLGAGPAAAAGCRERRRIGPWNPSPWRAT